jgi:two-component system chemotaxis response regulator CheY
MALNILIVDDSSVVRTVIAKTLRLAEAPVGELYEAANGRQALDLLRVRWIDLVFADINMPVMTGLELVDQMSREGLLASVPVVIVSTHGSQPQIDALSRKGIAAYIRKPFTPERIRQVVESLFGVRHGSQGPRPVE